MNNRRSETAGFKVENFWFLTKEGKLQGGRTQYSIRRKLIREDGSFYYERKPTRELKNISGIKELHDYVTRLNGRAYQEKLAKKVILTQHAWINHDLREKFRDDLETKIPNTKDARYLYSLCTSKFLKFYLDQLKIQDPNEWQENETLWGRALMNETKLASHRIWDKNFKPSVKTIKAIVQVANRFLDFLCKRYPAEYRNLKLSPLSTVQLKHYEANRLHDDPDLDRTKYISAEHWGLIHKKLPADIKPFVMLAYHYGLRRCEAMAVLEKDIREDFLSVERQMVACVEGRPKTKPLKSRKTRKTPHWMISASACFDIVCSIQKADYVHPDTFSAKWVTFMKELKLSYELHDLRRTFITNCFRIPRGEGIRGVDIMPTDIQMAVGHESIATTMKYKQDDRTLNDRVFRPKQK